MEIWLNFMFTIAGIIFGGLISWLINHCYYKKSLDDQKMQYKKYLEDQSQAWENSEKQLLEKLQDLGKGEDEFVKNELRIKEALEDYKRKGTPKYIIDTFNDLTKEQKARLYDDVLMRAKGRPGKNNPYK